MHFICKITVHCSYYLLVSALDNTNTLVRVQIISAPLYHGFFVQVVKIRSVKKGAHFFARRGNLFLKDTNETTNNIEDKR
jgi:hypothetical protein